MSEYQYYEFQAIDRPLTSKEMKELRSYSSRARITPASFINEYAWGSFKGNEDTWMEKYFDAFLYIANWGTHQFKLRLPARLLDPGLAREYCGYDNASVRQTAGNVILSFQSNDEEGGEWVEGEGQLSSLIPVRAELARGDLRALYLGWLLCAQKGELGDDEIEPPVPPGLALLSGSLKSLAEFLRIDDDLLHVAAETSVAVERTTPTREEARAWVATLPSAEKEDLLARLIEGADQTAATELLARFMRERTVRAIQPGGTRRTVGRLLAAADAHAIERERIEAERRARQAGEMKRAAARARQRHLDGIAGSEQRLWAEIDTLVASKHPKGYDRAVELLVDLRDLDARAGGADFGAHILAFRQQHARKPSFIERLRKAGL